jgi:arylsulfatase A-like enzyme
MDNISQATWTKVATPSIMTSLYPQSHRVFDAPHRLPAAAHTIAEVYREGGYATASFSSVAFTGRATNLHQGFEEVHESGSLNAGGSKTARPVVDGASDWLERHKDSSGPPSASLMPISMRPPWGESYSIVHRWSFNPVTSGW